MKHCLRSLFVTASGGMLLLAHAGYAADNSLPQLPGVSQATSISDNNKTTGTSITEVPAAASTTPAPAVPPIGAPEQPKVYSFGTAANSLFFTSSQIAMMRLALTAAENRPGLDTPQTLTVKDAAIAAPAEPSTYPVYHLDSIAYRSPTDWAVWVSGQKITPLKNPTSLKVVSINENEAVFTWSPDYQQALLVRNAQHSFASVTPVKHRLVKEQNVRLDDSKGMVTFALRPNQSFAAGYMSNFEGNIVSPQMPGISGLPSSAPMEGTPTANPQTFSEPPPASDKDASGGLAEQAIERMAAEANKEISPVKP